MNDANHTNKADWLKYFVLRITFARRKSNVSLNH